MRLLVTWCSLCLLLSPGMSASSVDISKAHIWIAPDISDNTESAVQDIITQFVNSNDHFSWKMTEASEVASVNIAIVRPLDPSIGKMVFPGKSEHHLPEISGEGFGIFLDDRQETTVIWLVCNRTRAVIYALGDLLRISEFNDKQITIKNDLAYLSHPAYPIRGHQLGYRNTANSYDAWSVDFYRKYILDLALFGTNAIENIPFSRDDSPHMKIPVAEMNIALSNICRQYDLEYWIWTPASFDLRDSSLRDDALSTHNKLYKDLPKLDNVFFPGGDPGHNHPRDVMPFLKELSGLLKEYHPTAGIWISLQGFSPEQIDYFYQYLDEHKPSWLRGVVSGPSSPSISQTRYRLGKEYKHRHYPDITHNVRCDYPVLRWDQAYALTLGREASNPQPYYYAKIHKKYAPHTDGFVSYSDGAHDDVNKIIWSQRGWDPGREIHSILKNYCKIFFGGEMSEMATNGIIALENNWEGPLHENAAVESTLFYWQNLEDKYPALQDNWRWQLLLLRSYYDAYIRRRLLTESDQEAEANKILLERMDDDINVAIKESLDKISESDKYEIAPDLKRKIEKYSDLLFQSVGLQSDSKKHKASNPQRGCIMDFVDYPLNNRWWYKDQFDKIDSVSSESIKKELLHRIATWDDPGEGCFYDNVSTISQSPRVKSTVYDAVDFAWWDGGQSRARLSWQTFQNDPILEYEDLDPNGRYLLRVTGYGDALARADGHRLTPHQYEKELGGFKEFIIPRTIVGDGKMKLTFDIPEESHINWRRQSRIAEVWLIKR